MAQINPHLSRRDVFNAMDKKVGHRGKTVEFNSKFIEKLKVIPGITPKFWKSDFKTAGGHFASNLKHSTWWNRNKPIEID